MNDLTDETVLRVNGLSKVYRIWNSPADRMKGPLLFRMGKGAQRVSSNLGARLIERASSKFYDFAALTDISFELRRGESLGIIGRNGAGKSTLLQIVAGTLEPSSGTVETRGRITALLELGSGFNPEFTGRENVYLNGAILGLSKAEMDERYEDIERFADIGDYIEQPIKFYSSGMLARLAFAVQVHLDPDILIVDEALAVGDAEFRAKAMNKTDEILGLGTTLLYVGHDLSAVQTFCSKVLRLEQGKIVESGDPETVITNYLYDVQRQRVTEKFGKRESLRRRRDGFAVEGAEVVDAVFADGNRHATLRFSDPIQMHFVISAPRRYEHAYLIFEILDFKNLELTGRRIRLPGRADGELLELEIGLSATFQQGIYRIRARLVEAPRINNTTILCRKDDVLSFEVIDDRREQFTGAFPMPMEIKWGEDVYP
jgi:lipopolysaccharide transport system ATP-binding protein